MKQTYHIIWVVFIILLIINSCSSDSAPPPVGPPSPHISRKDSLALVSIYKEGNGENWDNKWDLNDIST